jgi:hypothetical protein
MIVGALFNFNVTVDEVRQQTLEKIRKRQFIVVISVHSPKNRTYIIVRNYRAGILT